MSLNFSSIEMKNEEYNTNQTAHRGEVIVEDSLENSPIKMSKVLSNMNPLMDSMEETNEQQREESQNLDSSKQRDQEDANLDDVHHDQNCQ